MLHHLGLLLFIPPLHCPPPQYLGLFQVKSLVRNKTGLEINFPPLFAPFLPSKPELEVQHPLGEMKRSSGVEERRIRAIYASEEVQWKSIWHLEAHGAGPLRSPSIPLYSQGQVLHCPEPSLTDDLTAPAITSCNLLGHKVAEMVGLGWWKPLPPLTRSISARGCLRGTVQCCKLLEGRRYSCYMYQPTVPRIRLGTHEKLKKSFIHGLFGSSW